MMLLSRQNEPHVWKSSKFTMMETAFRAHLYNMLEPSTLLVTAVSKGLNYMENVPLFGLQNRTRFPVIRTDFDWQIYFLECAEKKCPKIAHARSQFSLICFGTLGNAKCQNQRPRQCFRKPLIRDNFFKESNA